MIAVILAGGTVAGPLATALGAENKALGRVGPRTLLEGTLAAARGCGADHVIAIGDATVARACVGHADETVPGTGSGRGNLARAFEVARGEALVLFASDMPFATAPAVRAFLTGTGDADVAMPVAGAAAYEAAFPGAPPHITAVGRDRVASGSVFYFAAGAGPRVLSVAQALFDARKSLLRMALLLGPTLAARFALRQIAIADVEARALRAFGVRAKAVRDCAPELCFDVDTLADFDYAAGRFARGGT